MNTADLLLEIGTEELPAKSLKTLSQALANNLEKGLKKAEIAYKATRTFATPRRLAVIIEEVQTHQNSRLIEKRGPSLKAAFDAQGHPTLACIGFANACHTTVDHLIVRETEKGAWLFYNQIEGGTAIADKLPDILQHAIQQLPIAKPMRWGSSDSEFARPVHWIVLLLGENVIKTELLGVTTGCHTLGHRFHHPQPIAIPHPQSYEKLLQETGYVIADFEVRKQKIWSTAQTITPPNTTIELDDALLDEITGLVEWPVALLGKFEDKFLEIPSEAIIATMKTNQRYFPVMNDRKELQPYFVLISNIESKHPEKIITGNQRVIHARLSDAQFFYHTDLQRSLSSYQEDLKQIIFQKELGTLWDKSERISNLAFYLAEQMNVNATSVSQVAQNSWTIELVKRAGLLCKADLATAMVGEFPELQGIMGFYYARNETDEVKSALRELYLPRFSGDKLPETVSGQLLAIADKIDTVVGFFHINQTPKADKDPYGLKRAALGILRILIEKEMPLDLFQIILKAYELHVTTPSSRAIALQVFDFMIERLRAWYLDQGIDASIFMSLWDSEDSSQHMQYNGLLSKLNILFESKACERPEAQFTVGVNEHRKRERNAAIEQKITFQKKSNDVFNPFDFHRRILAVQNFLTLTQAHALIAANKRVKNILKGTKSKMAFGSHPQFHVAGEDLKLIDEKLFEHPSEKTLFDAICKKAENIVPLLTNAHYSETLISLAELQKPIDDFFTHVMVMTDNSALKKNRLNLLGQLQHLFLQVADISKLTDISITHT